MNVIARDRRAALTMVMVLALWEGSPYKHPSLSTTTGRVHGTGTAVAESFFATIKGEMIDHEAFETRAEAIAAIADYIDNFYNVIRMHSSIDYMSPIEFELRLISKQEAA